MDNPDRSSGGGRNVLAAGRDADTWARYPVWNATCTCDICTSGNQQSGGGSTFLCNICLETARNAVVTICGHLYCWPCLSQWLMSAPNRKTCAVCRSALDNSQIVPIYGRNSKRPVAFARVGVPPRPTGVIRAPPRPTGVIRAPPRPSAQFVTISFCNGLKVSLSYGRFPFGPFRVSFSYADTEPETDTETELDSPGIDDPVQFGDEQLITNMFLFLCILSIGWLVAT